MSDDVPNSSQGSAMPISDMTEPLLAELRQIIRLARERVAIAVNAELTMLYWRIGERLRRGGSSRTAC